jgi:hypothetical protein
VDIRLAYMVEFGLLLVVVVSILLFYKKFK